MKRILLFFLLSISIKAQTTFTYNDLKKMTDGTMSEAVSLIKSKGLDFNEATEESVSYTTSKMDITMMKYVNGTSSLFLAGKSHETISKNILATVKNLGYTEIRSKPSGTLFCTSYDSKNYFILFCDGKVDYENGKTDPMYIISMEKKESGSSNKLNADW